MKNERAGLNKKGTIIFAVVAVLLLAVCLVLGSALAKCTFRTEERPAQAAAQFTDIVDSTDDIVADKLTELRGEGDVTALIESWATSGNDSLLSGGGVMNVLLVCADAGTTTTNFGNADLLCIVSINSKTKTVSVVSLDRDCFAYVAADGGTVFAKLNAAYANGGAALLRDTVEKNFKLKIDYYLTCTMDGLVKIIDGMGGVHTQADKTVAAYVLEDYQYTIPTEAGQALSGTHVSYYLRERRDGADARSLRQAQLVADVVKATQEMNIVGKFDFMELLTRYARTDCTGGDSLSGLWKTLLGGWRNFTVNAVAFPAAEDMQYYKGSSWVRVVDYPVVSEKLQKLLYSQTQIVLNTDRISALEVVAAVNKVYEDASIKAAEDASRAAERATEAPTEDDEDLLG